MEPTSQILFRADVAAAILGNIINAVHTTQAQRSHSTEPLRWMLIAYKSIALSMSINWPDLVTEVRACLGDDDLELLDALPAAFR